MNRSKVSSRRCLVALVSLVLTTVGPSCSWFRPAPVKFKDKAVQVSSKCRTYDDVVRVMGCEPGSYQTSDVSYPHSGHVVTRQLSGDTVRYWSGDDCCVVVIFRKDGLVSDVWILAPVEKGEMYSKRI